MGGRGPREYLIQGPSNPAHGEGIFGGPYRLQGLFHFFTYSVHLAQSWAVWDCVW